MSTGPVSEEIGPLWLSVAKAAEITGLSPYVLGNLVKEGKQLQGRKIGGKWYVHSESLADFNRVVA